jgi:hypothetical protein
MKRPLRSFDANRTKALRLLSSRLVEVLFKKNAVEEDLPKEFSSSIPLWLVKEFSCLLSHWLVIII